MDQDKPAKPRPEGPHTAEQAADWLLQLREGEPGEERLNEWMEWRGQDAGNGEAFDKAQTFAARIAATDRRALAGLIEEFGAPVPVRRRRAPVWAFAAAAGIAAVAAGVWMMPLGRHPVAGQVLAFDTPVAANRDINLPDGSHIALGAASTVRASFGTDARRVELGEGEAYFKVKHEEQRAFFVRAGRLTVRAVGTAFDVRKTGDRVTVTVTEGRVRVSEDNANAVEAAAGQQVAYSAATAGLRVSKIDTGDAVAWQQDRLEFVNEPLESVIANINRYSRRQLRIADPAVGRLSFTGTVQLQSLDRWLAGLQISFPVRVQTQADGVTITAAGADS